MNAYADNEFKRSDRMFWNHVVEPFINTFRDTFDFIWAKAFILATILLAQVTGFMDLFKTPQAYWWTLTLLVVCDASAKSIRLIFIEQCDWKLDKFIKKSIYKGTAYIIVCTMASAMSNQWEVGSNYVQYVFYLGLCILESFSIMRHFKITSFITALFQQVTSGKFDFSELKKQADRLEETEEYD